MKQAAIFDMDGLLLDTERLYQDGWVEAARRFGQTPHPDFARAISGTNGARAFEVIHAYYPSVDPPEFWNACVSYTRAILAKYVPKKPGTDEILAFFRANSVQMAVASSSEPDIIQNNLLHAGIADYFDAVVSGVQVTHGKPEPDIFLKAAELLGCEPTDCYVFEDSISGVQAGVAAGCVTVMVPDLTPPTDALRAICAGIYSSLSDVKEAVAAGQL